MGDGAEATPYKEQLGLPNGMTMRWGKDEGWYVGQIEDMPEVISQGRSLDELIVMILEAKALMEGDLETVEATFNRGLDDVFVDSLNREYDKKGWWAGFVDDPQLFVALRDNRVSVYYHGCSLAEIGWEGGKVVVRTHYKYLLCPSIDAPSAVFVDGAYRLPRDASALFVTSPAEVESLKRAARPYAGGEKTGVQRIIDSNRNILDVEVAFGIGGTEASDPSAPRIDFAALQAADDGGQVVFYEAKRFANPELRAKKPSIPKAVRQIDRYSAILRDNRAKIVERYGRVCDNLLSLHGMSARHPKRHAMLERIAGKPLSIDPEPRLVVFGFDADQRDGHAWKPHRKRLFDLLGKKRVLLKGKSKGFRRGIA